MLVPRWTSGGLGPTSVWSAGRGHRRGEWRGITAGGRVHLVGAAGAEADREALSGGDLSRAGCVPTPSERGDGPASPRVEHPDGNLGPAARVTAVTSGNPVLSTSYRE
ncbi:hypothetical protein GCM10010428_71720 [Actinosynnema pretiosum subsp. pretiosum]